MRRVTMADIAAKAGVSRATVSRALRNDAQISPSTVQRVQAIAREMGFERDPAFEVLAHQRRSTETAAFRYTIAFLKRGDIQAGAYLEGAKQRAGEQGYSIDVFDLDEHSNSAALNRTLLARGVRGILMPAISKKMPLPELQWERFSVVCCSVDYRHLPFHLVRTNVVAKIQIAWDACMERGFKRIGVVLAHDGPNELDVRRAGTAMYLISERESADQVPLLFQPFSSIWHAFNPWMIDHGPDVLILSHPALVSSLVEMDLQTGRRTPYCCLLPLENCAYVGSRPQLIGATAMSVLHQQIVENRRGYPKNPYTVITDPEWVDGPSMDVE